MRLYPDIWIEGGYYVDFDTLGQLRIIGPNNHLFCGLIDIPRHQITLQSVETLLDTSLRIRGWFSLKSLRLYEPAMGDIRTMRKLLKPSPQFLKLRQQQPAELRPELSQLQHTPTGSALTFRRTYNEHIYQTVWLLPKQVAVKQVSSPLKGFELTSSTKRIPFELIADTDDVHNTELGDIFITHPTDFNWRVFGRLAPLVKRELKLTGHEIEHLLSWNKTSGDRFGTVFPRDWMESADLGVHDLTATARMHMYRQSLRHVDRAGVGWHEDVVGELAAQHRLRQLDLVDRHMIDIEPHYIIGLEKLPDEFLMNKEVSQKIQRVAKLIIQTARQRQPINFKKKNSREYFPSGNWRDSTWAFKKLSTIIAPFDVNAVFYPKALEVLHDKQRLLGLHVPDLHRILEDWMEVKEQFRFTNGDGRTAFALAVFDKKTRWSTQQKKSTLMRVNHLDESYYFTYLDGTKEEVESFVDRLLDPEYFYTPSGPLLIAKNNQYGFTSDEYHGEVIWTKQVAYALLGLSKHLKTAIIQEWPLPLKRKIKQAILKTSENMIKVYNKLGYVPEVHTDEGGKPILPQDPEGVSRVQLWSAVGARRIFRKRYDMETDLRYKFHDDLS